MHQKQHPQKGTGIKKIRTVAVLVPIAYILFITKKSLPRSIFIPIIQNY